MEITLKIMLDASPALTTLLNAIIGAHSPMRVENTLTEKPSPAQRPMETRTKQAEDTKDAPHTTMSQPEEAQPEEAPAPSTSDMTIEMIRARTQAAVDKHGKAAVKKVLTGQFRVDKMPDLRPEQYNDYVQALSAL